MIYADDIDNERRKQVVLNVVETVFLTGNLKINQDKKRAECSVKR